MTAGRKYGFNPIKMREKPRNHALVNALWAVSGRTWKDHGIAWLPPVCPKCQGILSAKMASTRLVCLSCGYEFTLMEVKATRTV